MFGEKFVLILLVTYALGYFGWLGYALNRFSDGPDWFAFQAVFAVFWPINVVVYVPYRLSRWISVDYRIPKNRWDD